VPVECGFEAREPVCELCTAFTLPPEGYEFAAEGGEEIDFLLPALRNAEKKVLIALHALRKEPGGQTRAIRERHIRAMMEKLDDEIVSRDTVSHALVTLRRLGILGRDAALGIVSLT
jgi:hypothetical protein